MDIPIKFNCLFNINNPTEYTISELTVTQSIYEGFYPISTIDDGHKHTLICKFKDGIIPDIVNKLYIGVTHKSPNLPKDRFMMGMCDYANLQYITERFNNVKTLKERYSDKWREYDF